MKKELSMGTTVALIAVVVVVVIAIGWYVINRNPEPTQKGGSAAIPGQPKGTVGGAGGTFRKSD